MKVAAPAKINLSLRVTGRRPDGFHELDTVMIPLALQDVVHIERADAGISVSTDDPDLPGDFENLAGRAVQLYLDAIDRRDGFRLRIEKAIPVEAGLGGGSSDAAAALVGVNELLGRVMSDESLARVAESVGADVPFFLEASPRRCLGKGERMEAPLALSEYPVLIVKPPFGVSTAWAYRTYARLSDGKATPTAMFEGIDVVNDLELPVFSKFVVLPVLGKALSSHPETLAAGMSGSGSAMFAITSTVDAAEALADGVRSEFGDTFRTYVTHTRSAGRSDGEVTRT